MNLMWRASCWVCTRCSEVRITSILCAPCLGACSHLWGPGQAWQIWAAALHQTFWRHGLVPAQCSQGGWAYSGHAEERAVSLSVCVWWMHAWLIQVFCNWCSGWSVLSLFVLEPDFKLSWATPATVPAGKELWPKPCVCVCVFRFQDAVSLVSLFHMVHPHSESAQEAATQQATGTDLLKVRTTQPWLKISADS